MGRESPERPGDLYDKLFRRGGKKHRPTVWKLSDKDPDELARRALPAKVRNRMRPLPSSITNNVRPPETDPLEKLQTVLDQNPKADQLFQELTTNPLARDSKFGGRGIKDAYEDPKIQSFMKFFRDASKDKTITGEAIQQLLFRSLVEIGRNGNGNGNGHNLDAKEDDFLKFKNKVKAFSSYFYRALVFNYRPGRTRRIIQFLEPQSPEVISALARSFEFVKMTALRPAGLTMESGKDSVSTYTFDPKEQVRGILSERAAQYNSEPLRIISEAIEEQPLHEDTSDLVNWEKVVFGNGKTALSWELPAKELLLQNQQELKTKLTALITQMPQRHYFDNQDRSFAILDFPNNSNEIAGNFGRKFEGGKMPITLRNSPFQVSATIGPNLEIDLPHLFKAKHPQESILLENHILASLTRLVSKAKEEKQTRQTMKTSPHAYTWRQKKGAQQTPTSNNEIGPATTLPEVQFTDEFESKLENLPEETVELIMSKLESLSSGKLKIEKVLSGRYKGNSRARAGDYRIIFRREDLDFVIITAERRDEVYRNR